MVMTTHQTRNRLDVTELQESLSPKACPPEASGNRKSCSVLWDAPGMTHSEMGSKLDREIMVKDNNNNMAGGNTLGSRSAKQIGGEKEGGARGRLLFPPSSHSSPTKFVGPIEQVLLQPVTCDSNV